MEHAYGGGSNLLHLSPDTVVAAVIYQLSRRSSERRRNMTPYLLRGLICKLYGAGQGNLWRAQVRASQTALAADQGVSLPWTNELNQRLVTAGRSRYHALRFLDWHFEVSFFNITAFS